MVGGKLPRWGGVRVQGPGIGTFWGYLKREDRDWGSEVELNVAQAPVDNRHDCEGCHSAVQMRRASIVVGDVGDVCALLGVSVVFPRN